MAKFKEEEIEEVMEFDESTEDDCIIEHFNDEDDCVIEDLTEEEIEETEGGAAQYTAYQGGGRKAKYYGRINCSTNGQTCYVQGVIKKLGPVAKVVWISNPINAIADWTPNIFVVNKRKLRGSALLKAYGRNGDYVQVLAKFT